MTRMVFQDFDQFTDTLCGVTGRCVPTARSTTTWWVHNLSTGRVLTQTLQIGSAATFAGQGKHDEIALLIPLTDPAGIRIDGQPLERDSFLLIHEGQPFTLTATEATRWAGIVVPVNHELLAAELMQSLRSRLCPASTTSHTRTDAEHLGSIRSVVARLAAASDSGAIDAVAVRCAEEEIIGVVSRALEAGSKPASRRLGRPTFSRGQIIASVLALIGGSAGAPLFVEDLRRAAGVSERTLRNVFHEFFGCGPVRLLKLRQLHEIRAALLAADPKHDTVTGIATRFGIWDLSLFARNYRALFGEAPLQTLRSVSTRALLDTTARATWLDYASRAFSQFAVQA
jgi:AraC family transcriptional regulator, ethanolamine operon transcriptional activator